MLDSGVGEEGVLYCVSETVYPWPPDGILACRSNRSVLRRAFSEVLAKGEGGLSHSCSYTSVGRGNRSLVGKMTWGLANLLGDKASAHWPPYENLERFSVGSDNQVIAGILPSWS